MANERGRGNRNARRGVRKSTGGPAGRGKGRPTGRKPAARKRGVAKPKPRVKPSVRANARRAKINQRPLPKPPARRKPITRATVRPEAREANQELHLAVSQVQSRFENLEADAQLSDVYNAIGAIDTQLTELPFTLEALRTRGYVHSGQLEDQLEAIDDRWDDVRPRVESALRSQVRSLDNEMDQTERQVDRLRPTNMAAVRGVETAVNGLNRRIGAARSAVLGLFNGIDNELDQIEYELHKVSTVLDLLDGSQEIRLQEAEGPLLAVETEWHQDGDEGPKGVLFLTDQRLMFEQREEVVTKKRFGIFKADSEMVQKLHIEVSVPEIESLEHKEEGGFLGMGKADILEFVFAASAPLSRARFHLKGQDSSDWAAMIKRIQTEEIDEDRADEYVEELEAAEETAASFPAQCPNCFAEVPEQTRGIISYTCEFCGNVIAPEGADE